MGRPILLVARGLDPVGSGGELELLANGLTAAGLRVEVAAMTGGGSVPERLAARGIPVHRLSRRPQMNAGSVGQLAGLAWRTKPAAIIGFGRSQAWPLTVACRFAAGSRGMLRLGLPPAGLRQARLVRQLDRLLVTSPAVARACRRAGAGAGRIVLAEPGVASPAPAGLDREAVAARIGLDPACRWTLAIAPLEPTSRLERLLWAIDQLGVVRKDLQHVLVGSGPLLHAIRRRARAQELSERLFILPHAAVLPELLAHTAIVWQSGEVALGGCLLDGMARGVPAVAVESEAARQLIAAGETGRIMPALPESEFPRRVFGILEDDALAARYAAAAAARAADRFPAARLVNAVITALADPR